MTDECTVMAEEYTLIKRLIKIAKRRNMTTLIYKFRENSQNDGKPKLIIREIKNGADSTACIRFDGLTDGTLCIEGIRCGIYGGEAKLSLKLLSDGVFEPKVIVGAEVLSCMKFKLSAERLLFAEADAPVVSALIEDVDALAEKISALEALVIEQKKKIGEGYTFAI